MYALTLVLQKFIFTPLNIYTDSVYIAQPLPPLEMSMALIPTTTAFFLFTQLQQILWSHRDPIFITHIHAHMSLPELLAQGNHADSGTLVILPILTSPVSQAIEFHNLFYCNAKALQDHFRLTCEQAVLLSPSVSIVLSYCQHQAMELIPEVYLAITFDKWTSPFGTLKFIHV